MVFQGVMHAVLFIILLIDLSGNTNLYEYIQMSEPAGQAYLHVVRGRCIRMSLYCKGACKIEMALNGTNFSRAGRFAVGPARL